ncbi:MAG: hypothetical protein GXP05_12790 [Alphaproteobacteria bacterium]|nr:hypothetical protein [Alphaproteobacteria bacterium]
MQLSEMKFDGPVPVDGYGPGFFRVADQLYQGAIIVLPGEVLSWEGLADLSPLLAAAQEYDVLFVGTGPTHLPLAPEFLRQFDKLHLGVEPMATPAACRTYNVLLSEGRRVAAALLPV